MNATVSEKGQVTIPAELRRKMGLEKGSRLRFELDAQGRLTAALLPRGAAGLAGLLRRPGERSRSLQEMDSAVTEAVRQRAGRKK